MTTQEQTILDKKIKGLTWRIIITGVIGLLSIEATLLKLYFSLDNHNMVQDMRIQSNAEKLNKIEDRIYTQRPQLLMRKQP